MGAVAYDPKVVTIWEGFKPYFEKRGAPIDYVLYSSYDAQVEANLAGEIEVAWNSPLAWVKSQLVSHGGCRAIAMRDTDRDLTTKILARKDSNITSLADLKGKTIAVGRLGLTSSHFDPSFRCWRMRASSPEKTAASSITMSWWASTATMWAGSAMPRGRWPQGPPMPRACSTPTTRSSSMRAHSIPAPHACWPLRLPLTTAISPYAGPAGGAFQALH